MPSVSQGLNICSARQDQMQQLRLWKWSLVEDEYKRGKVMLDLKTDVRHFREDAGFEVPES